MVLLAETKSIWDEFLTSHSLELREQLVLESVPLVHFLLRRLGITPELGPEYEDLVHQGLLGLIEAIDKYNPSFGTQFSSFASMRIRGRVLDFLRRADWMTRTARKRVRRIQSSVDELWSTLQREPTDDEIAANLNLDINQVQKGLYDAHLTFVSMDAPTKLDEEQDDLHERIVDDSHPNPSDVVEDVELKGQLISGIQKRPERDQLLLSLYYHDQLHFKEIGRVMGITESRVCQLHARAILNLKAVMQNE
jgi:RNA polymerase sigma factor for flagellar operon FliA